MLGVLILFSLLVLFIWGVISEARKGRRRSAPPAAKPVQFRVPPLREPRQSKQRGWKGGSGPSSRWK